METKKKTISRLRCEQSFTTPGVGDFIKGKIYDVVPSESAQYGSVPERLRDDWVKQGKFSEDTELPAVAEVASHASEDE